MHSNIIPTLSTRISSLLNKTTVFCFFLSFTIICFGIYQFVEYKEYPHCCIMTDASGEKLTLVDNNDNKNDFGYQLFEFQDKRFLHSSKKEEKDEKEVSDLVFFVHGNSGNVGEGRWYLSELSKLLFSHGHDDHSSSSTSSKNFDVNTNKNIKMFSFSFLEEANIHSGKIVQRQIDFVVEKVLSIFFSSVTNNKKKNNNNNNNNNKKCIWFISHSMGGIITRKAIQRILHDEDDDSSFSQDHIKNNKINICGVIILASPQYRLPIHVDSNVRDISENYHTDTIFDENNNNLNNNKNKKKKKKIGIILSLSGGAGDVEVYEPLTFLHSHIQQHESHVSLSVSSIALAGISTSHHGITYCHQLVRPLMKSLVWLMSEKRVRQFLISSANNDGDSLLTLPSFIKTTLVNCFLGPSSLSISPPSYYYHDDLNNNKADIDSFAQEEFSISEFFEEISQNNYEICSSSSSNNKNNNDLSELSDAFENNRILVLSASSTDVEQQQQRTNKKEDIKEEEQVEKNELKEEIKTSSSSSSITFAVPWRAARHNVFRVILDSSSSSSKIKKPFFIRAITSISSSSSDYSSYHNSNNHNVALEKTNTIRLLKNEAMKSKQLSRLLLLRKDEDHHHHSSSSSSFVISSSTNNKNNRRKSRIFWSNTEISSGADIFWISAKFNSRQHKQENPTLFPTILSRCENINGGEANSISQPSSSVRFLIGLNDDSSSDDDTLALTQEWLWIPSFDRSTLRLSSSSSSLSSSFATKQMKCELMLLSEEEICNQQQENENGDEEINKNDNNINNNNNNCWNIKVSSASLPMRMIHAARHCGGSSYELIWSCSIMLFASCWILIFVASQFDFFKAAVVVGSSSSHSQIPLLKYSSLFEIISDKIPKFLATTTSSNNINTIINFVGVTNTKQQSTNTNPRTNSSVTIIGSVIIFFLVPVFVTLEFLLFQIYRRSSTNNGSSSSSSSCDIRAMFLASTFTLFASCILLILGYLFISVIIRNISRKLLNEYFSTTVMKTTTTTTKKIVRIILIFGCIVISILFPSFSPIFAIILHELLLLFLVVKSSSNVSKNSNTVTNPCSSITVIDTISTFSIFTTIVDVVFTLKNIGITKSISTQMLISDSSSFAISVLLITIVLISKLLNDYKTYYYYYSNNNKTLNLDLMFSNSLTKFFRMFLVMIVILLFIGEPIFDVGDASELRWVICGCVVSSGVFELFSFCF